MSDTIIDATFPLTTIVISPIVYTIIIASENNVVSVAQPNPTLVTVSPIQQTVIIDS